MGPSTLLAALRIDSCYISHLAPWVTCTVDLGRVTIDVYNQVPDTIKNSSFDPFLPFKLSMKPPSAKLIAATLMLDSLFGACALYRDTKPLRLDGKVIF